MAMIDDRNLPAQVLERLASVPASELAAAGLEVVQRGRRLEARAQPIELRTDADGDPIIDGYATVYEHAYEVAGGPPYGWIETMAQGACDKSVRERDDVRLLFDHEGLPLARTAAGTLELESDKDGLRCAGQIDPTSHHGSDVLRALQRGDLDAMSMAFRVMRQEWNDDYTERRITEVKLFDVSVVTYPANPATVAQLRSHLEAEAEQQQAGRSLVLARAQAARASLRQ